MDYHANNKKDSRNLHDSADQGKKGSQDIWVGVGIAKSAHKGQKCVEHFLLSRLILKLMDGIE